MAERELSRRHFVAATSAAGVAITGGVGKVAFAQEGTPGATPETPPEAEGALVVSAEGPVAETLGPAIPDELTSSETNWAVEGGNLQATRFATGSSISSDTVGELGTAWTVPYDVPGFFGSLTSNPIVVGDVVYMQDVQSNVKALNKETGEVIWANDYGEEVPSGGPNGVAVGYGFAVYPVGVGNVVGVRADTGEEVWRIDITGPRGEGITMAPAIHDSTVYISTIPAT